MSSTIGKNMAVGVAIPRYGRESRTDDYADLSAIKLLMVVIGYSVTVLVNQAMYWSGINLHSFLGAEAFSLSPIFGVSIEYIVIPILFYIIASVSMNSKYLKKVKLTYISTLMIALLMLVISTGSLYLIQSPVMTVRGGDSFVDFVNMSQVFSNYIGVAIYVVLMLPTIFVLMTSNQAFYWNKKVVALSSVITLLITLMVVALAINFGQQLVIGYVATGLGMEWPEVNSYFGEMLPVVLGED